MKNHIPNLLTLLNLFCGTIAVIFVINDDFYTASLLVLAGIFFDFLDGFVARLLSVQGELGKQLDSLADVVTSGVVPGIIMLKLLQNAVNYNAVGYFGAEETSTVNTLLPYIGVLLTLGAAYRLAKFNIDTRQGDNFIGLPTPAMSLFVISLPLIAEFANSSLIASFINNKYLLIGVTLSLTYLMNAELPLFSLKFKDYSFKNNTVKYVFLLASILLSVVFKIVAVPLVIVLYVIMSVYEVKRN